MLCAAFTSAHCCSGDMLSACVIHSTEEGARASWKQRSAPRSLSTASRVRGAAQRAPSRRVVSRRRTPRALWTPRQYSVRQWSRAWPDDAPSPRRGAVAARRRVRTRGTAVSAGDGVLSPSPSTSYRWPASSQCAGCTAGHSRRGTRHRSRTLPTRRERRPSWHRASRSTGRAAVQVAQAATHSSPRRRRAPGDIAHRQQRVERLVHRLCPIPAPHAYEVVHYAGPVAHDVTEVAKRAEGDRWPRTAA